MTKIKAVVRVDDRTNTHYTKTFLVRNSLPKAGAKHLGYITTAAEPVQIDFENCGDEYAAFDFYRVTSVDAEHKGTENEGEYTSFDYIATLKPETKDCVDYTEDYLSRYGKLNKYSQGARCPLFTLNIWSPVRTQKLVLSVC